MLRCTCSKHDQFNFHRKARRNLATSSWWHIKLKCLKCNERGHCQVLRASQCSVIIFRVFSKQNLHKQERVIENGAVLLFFFSLQTPLLTSPQLGFQPLLTCGAFILFLTKTAHHTWLTKLRNNARACLRWLWLRRAVVSRPPPHCRDTEGLLHNLRPGCFASVIKGIALGSLCSLSAPRLNTRTLA